MLSEKYRHIVIEGPIGVGKTSLARLIAQRFQAELLLEKPEDNPFLEKFYQEPARYALPTQLFFLFQRIGQLRDLTQRDFFENMVVSDFLLEKDRMFASLTLDEEELKLYQQIYQHQSPQTSVPDLVIYLQASPQALIERVQKRATPYEVNITEARGACSNSGSSALLSRNWAFTLTCMTSAQAAQLALASGRLSPSTLALCSTPSRRPKVPSMASARLA